MNIAISQIQGQVSVTILCISGDLDAASYTDLIAAGQGVCRDGARHLLLDMSGMPYMSSAGLVALHNLALMVRGEQPPDPESGWNALHAVSREHSNGLQTHIKLLSPQPQVDKVLERVGFKQFFEIHTDRATALASFR